MANMTKNYVSDSEKRFKCGEESMQTINQLFYNWQGQDIFLYGFPFSWQEYNNRAGFNIDVLGMNDVGDGECDKGKL